MVAGHIDNNSIMKIIWNGKTEESKHLDKSKSLEKN